jgi:hypothetical protein
MNIVLAVVVFFVVFIIGLRLMEDSMIYFPSKYPAGFWQPSAYGVAVEDCYFTAEDGVRLHGWFAPREGARHTLLWCHGNAGNISDRLGQLKPLLEQVDAHVLMLDYRGYGRSEGAPDEEGLYKDARAAYDYLLTRREVDPRKIVPFGQSLGGAVAVDVAVQRPCAGLILESTFTSGKDMAKKAFPGLPVFYFIRTRFDSDAKIANLHIPILFMHGTVDGTVPFALGKKLYEAANQPKEFYEVPGADHNDPFVVGGAAYFAKINGFILQTSDLRPQTSDQRLIPDP